MKGIKTLLPTECLGLAYHHNSFEQNDPTAKRAVHCACVTMVLRTPPIIYGIRLVCHKKRAGASNVSAGDSKHKLQ